jgi:hypothetical protein
VTVGHNIEYHCIVYTYGRRKYGESKDRAHRVARMAFANDARIWRVSRDRDVQHHLHV